MKIFQKLRYYYVKYIYGDHNSSFSVKYALSEVIKNLPKDGFGLNIGAGKSVYDNRIKNLDIDNGENIDFVGNAEDLPFSDNSVDLIICQEVLEHTQNFNKVLSEMYRVLKPKGQLYLQVPFIIGYHPCPKDFWRFTHEGMDSIVLKQNFIIESKGKSVGSATGFYRVSVEFFAILFSILIPFAYKPFKAFFALVLYPIKWLDPLLEFSKEANRISGGYYLIAKK